MNSAELGPFPVRHGDGHVCFQKREESQQEKKLGNRMPVRNILQWKLMHATTGPEPELWPWNSGWVTEEVSFTRLTQQRFPLIDHIEQKRERNQGFDLIFLTGWMVMPFAENHSETNGFVPQIEGLANCKSQQIQVRLAWIPSEGERENMKVHVKSGHCETLSVNFNRMGHELSKREDGLFIYLFIYCCFCHFED